MDEHTLIPAGTGLRIFPHRGSRGWAILQSALDPMGQEYWNVIYNSESNAEEAQIVLAKIVHGLIIEWEEKEGRSAR